MLQLAIIPQSVLDGFEGILEFWHGIVGSWGMAIVMLTFTIRLLILPLTFKSVKGMQKLQVLQPEIKKIQERYKDDKQRMQQEVMKFYQERKVNPLASCLPLLLQIPFFISLFYLLRDDEFEQEIRGEESFLFIPDLAASATEHVGVLAVLVVLYVATQLGASLVTMISADPMQRRLMLGLPLFFVVILITANFPAGLWVYWITTNVWTVGQQLAVKKFLPMPEPVAPSAEEEGKRDPAKAATPAGAAAAVSGSETGERRPGFLEALRSGGAGRGAADGRGAGDGERAEAPGADGRAKAPADGGDGGPRKRPPPSPRKKKRKRSGRRR